MIWAIIFTCLFFVMATFFYLEQKRKIRKRKQAEQRRARFQQLMRTLKMANKEKNDEVSDTTGAE